MSMSLDGSLGASLLVLLASGTPSRDATIAENEALVIEDLRTLMSAMDSYNGGAGGCGFPGELRCLAEPQACGLREDVPRLIDPALASLKPRHGYRRAFQPGRPPNRGKETRCGGPPGFRGFAYTAVPEREGVTGNLGFCVDEHGFIRQFESGTGLTPEGRCQPGLTADGPPATSLEEQERRTVGELRTLASAEEAFRASNSGYYDQPRCLAEPWVCVSHYPRAAPVFLDPRIADLRERHAYRRQFHPGPPPPSLNRWSSPSSLLGYAYTAVPVRGGPPGRRGFCVDASGVICQTVDGTEPSVVNGRCLPCEALIER